MIAVAALLAVPILFGFGLGWYTLNPSMAESLSPVGSDAHELLNSFPDGSLVVEFDYQTNVGPPPAASVSLLEQRVNATCNKASVSVVEHPFSSSTTNFHESDLLSLEDSVRHVWPGVNTMALDYLYLGGSDADHPSVLGLSFQGSSIAVFAGTVQSFSPGAETTAVTSTVLVHEFGHELGLVGVVGSAPNEDPNHPGHSNDPNDVMYWSVETTDVLGGLLGGGGPPTQFDIADLQDLSSVRATPILQEVLPGAALAVCLVAAGYLILRARRGRSARTSRPQSS